MHRNLRRYDLSDRLIHFTRPVDLLDDSAPGVLPIEWPFGECVEDDLLSPFFLLRRILRTRQVMSTWSYRKGKPTVYGPHPAVCFTEMPLAAFLKASKMRSRNKERISSYAVLLRKEHTHAVGARPVIYGLSALASATMLPDGTRRFPSEVLPEREQYRYVAYDTSQKGLLDWTHEREWRWPNRDFPFFEPHEVYTSKKGRKWTADREEDRSKLDGLNLDCAPFKDIGFIVKTQKQARLLLHDILRMVDSGDISEDLFTFILCLELMPTRLIAPKAVDDAIAASAVDLSPYFGMSAAMAAKTARKLRRIIAKHVDAAEDDGSDEAGGCWLWLHDNTHPLVRALVQRREILISRRGRYLVELPKLAGSLSLSVRQEITSQIATAVAAEFGTTSSYFLVMDSDDPDEVPFFADLRGALQSIYLNYAHHKADF